jgi:hypothetical protein
LYEEKMSEPRKKRLKRITFRWDSLIGEEKATQNSLETIIVRGRGNVDKVTIIVQNIEHLSPLDFLVHTLGEAIATHHVSLCISPAIYSDVLNLPHYRRKTYFQVLEGEWWTNEDFRVLHNIIYTGIKKWKEIQDNKDHDTMYKRHRYPRVSFTAKWRSVERDFHMWFIFGKMRIQFFDEA